MQSSFHSQMHHRISVSLHDLYESRIVQNPRSICIRAFESNLSITDGNVWRNRTCCDDRQAVIELQVICHSSKHRQRIQSSNRYTRTNKTIEHICLARNSSQ